ncbi:hypothetical protein BCR33DRAFT_714739 [Rhizoclosmatium globosum]|uniref:mannan endo-1,4-beta-mannosidase n=1 Tax=Rhizoclosmatium globosum TaxID=329046 RepID=A0A1Y2CKX1_9FUNG|nr:hypothetical protein BCR33DRAFT_714739 [Rhizoclosmatium globosum]|eukprot:ORY47636.1 hypothetical protein BCR33DRAFT_714739 [Rhizoclosmatium globosum]
MIQLGDNSFVLVGQDNLLYTCPTAASTIGCLQIKGSGSVKSIGLLTDKKTLLGVGMDGYLYTRAGLYGNWQFIPNSGTVIDITVLSNGVILGTGPDLKLYTRQTLTSNWVFIGACCVYSTAQLDDGSILGVGQDNKLYTRQTLTADWVFVPDSGTVVSVASVGYLPTTGIPDYTSCTKGDVCQSSGFVCCLGKLDLESQKYTCRPSGAGSDCFTATLSTPTFAGVNSYFIANLPVSNQQYLLSSLQQAGITVVRIFITQFGVNGKNTLATGQPDLEPTTIGVYNDTVLTNLDSLLALVPQYNIKLIIAMHDRWNLDNTWGTCDAYCLKYCKLDPTTNKCTSQGGAGSFYTDPTAQQSFDNRLAYILSHKNPRMNNRAWKDIPESIYAFEFQNEAQGSLNLPNPDWWCTRATNLKKLLSNNGIKIGTGGGQTFADSIIDNNFNCPALDLIAIHNYDPSAWSLLPSAVDKAIAAGKMIVIEEFGLPSDKAGTVAAIAQLANDHRVPWMPWEVSTVSQPGDFEFSPVDGDVWNALAKYSKFAV